MIRGIKDLRTLAEGYALMISLRRLNCLLQAMEDDVDPSVTAEMGFTPGFPISEYL